MTAATCPHCGAHHDDRMMPTHVARCPRNPVVHAATLALLTDPETGGAVSAATYAAARQDHPDALTIHNLHDLYGKWEDVCAAYGLERKRKLPAQSKRTADAAWREEQRIAAEQAAAIVRTRAEEQDRGLPVCGVRRLPDGSVAWMVR